MQKSTATAIFFPVGDDDLAFLKAQWDDLVSFYTSDRSLTDQTFRLLERKYSEKSRFYHNLSHLALLLNLFAAFGNQIQGRNAVRFSIWFHDLVYDTKRNDNEAESARLASEMLERLHVGARTTAHVIKLILGTRDHSGKRLAADARLFLDMDLAILGTDRRTYEKYSRAIRAEYAWVPEQIYRQNRRKILASFLDRERIYFTDIMRVKFEEQARKNIRREIKSFDVS